MTTELAKTIRLKTETWDHIADIRFAQRFRSEADAIRAIIEAGITKLTPKPKQPTKKER